MTVGRWDIAVGIQNNGKKQVLELAVGVQKIIKRVDSDSESRLVSIDFESWVLWSFLRVGSLPQASKLVFLLILRVGSDFLRVDSFCQHSLISLLYSSESRLLSPASRLLYSGFRIWCSVNFWESARFFWESTPSISLLKKTFCIASESRLVSLRVDSCWQLPENVFSVVFWESTRFPESRRELTRTVNKPKMGFCAILPVVPESTLLLIVGSFQNGFKVVITLFQINLSLFMNELQ